MPAIASVHLADVEPGAALRLLAPGGGPGAVAGLRQGHLATAAPLTPDAVPRPPLGRVGFVAFWDDDAALDRFLAGHPLAERLAGGWRARLEPLRRHGTWPGLDDDVTQARRTGHTGPAVVLTLGRVRIAQVPRFLRTSARAEAAALAAPGCTWATALARPPFVGTCSLWTSAEALSAYAYGSPGAGHPAAMAADRDEPFHHRSAFVRFRPYDVQGSLDGDNPLAPGALVEPPAPAAPAASEPAARPEPAPGRG
ncbi:MAG TPA: hypothetical protein VHK88_00220 [Aquihabitans sp.]|nr:hypothetical protein [Aquihabitans sp.]